MNWKRLPRKVNITKKKTKKHIILLITNDFPIFIYLRIIFYSWCLSSTLNFFFALFLLFLFSNTLLILFLVVLCFMYTFVSLFSHPSNSVLLLLSSVFHHVSVLFGPVHVFNGVTVTESIPRLYFNSNCMCMHTGCVLPSPKMKSARLINMHSMF